MSSQNNNTKTISEIYKSRKNILEIMEKQGYNIENYSNFNINEVNTLVQHDQLDMLLSNEKKNINIDSNIDINEKPKPVIKVYIKFWLSTKLLKSDDIQFMIEDLFILTETLTKNDTLFIIVKNEVNDSLKEIIKNIWEKDKIFIVVECINCLQFNILNHQYVPEHNKISEEELIEIMDKYNIKNLSEMPDISRFDPVARVICLRPGEVCRILRPSKTAIMAPYYRVCV